MLNKYEHYYHLHKNPEVSMHEYETTKYLQSILENYNLNIYELEPTGLICTTKTNNDKTLLFRADIDALPILEETGSDYKSLNDGVMHACGHDMHMSGLLMFIDKIMPRVDKLSFDLIFVFQPSEERDGGAQIVINHDIVKNANIVASHAVHVMPQINFKQVATKKGTLLGTNKVFSLNLKGTSSHASTPQFANSVLEPMMHFINFTNELIAKHNDPQKPLVINIGQISGGSVVNATMADITINSTMRAVEDEQINYIYEKIEKYVHFLESIYDIRVNLEQIEKSCPATINDSRLVDDLVDDNILILDEPLLAVEDFGYYKNIAPSLMFFVGTNKGENESLHSSTFLPDVEVIDTISELYIDLVDKHENI